MKNKNNHLYINPISTTHTFSHVDNTAATVDQLKKLLKNSTVSITSIDIASDSALVVKNSNGEIYIFSQNKDLLLQISSLQRIKTQLTIEGKRLKTLDLRFDDPVVTFF